LAVVIVNVILILILILILIAQPIGLASVVLDYFTTCTCHLPWSYNMRSYYYYS